MSTTDTDRSAPPPITPRPRRADLVVMFCLAGASGAALVAQVIWHLEMSWTAGMLVLPATALVVVAAFAGQRRYDRLRIVSDRLVNGAKWGLIATLAYDVARPLVVWAFRFDFWPYKAHVIFGTLITGRPEHSAMAITVGWTYHFWNGIGFGTMLSLIKPRAGWAWGLAWALMLQVVMMIIYPKFLQVRLDHPPFMVTTIIGHSVYGLVLGTGLRRTGRE